MSIKLKVLSVIILFAAFGVVMFLWDHFHLPTSVNETIFRHRLTEKASLNAPNIILSELMPGNWELVCDMAAAVMLFYRPKKDELLALTRQ